MLGSKLAMFYGRFKALSNMYVYINAVTTTTEKAQLAVGHVFFNLNFCMQVFVWITILETHNFLSASCLNKILLTLLCCVTL